MDRKRIKQLIRKINPRPNYDTLPIGTKLHAFAKLTQSFPRTPVSVVAQLVNNISRRGEPRRKLISQRPQYTRRKTSITSTTLHDGQLVTEPHEIPCKRRSKQLTALWTRAIVACPAPAFSIRTLIIATVRIVERRLHPIVKSDTAFTSNYFP